MKAAAVAFMAMVVSSGGASAAEMARSTASSGEELEKGEQLYRDGRYADALAALQVARQHQPNDADAALLLGLTHLRLDDPARASIHWTEYVRLAQDRQLAGDVKKYVTILLREANLRAARDAVSAENHLATLGTDPRTVAIGAFGNLGSVDVAPLGKALAAMLIDNLSGIRGLRVLERQQVQALLDEAKLAQSGLVREDAAVRAGKLLRAGRIGAGTYADWVASPPHLKIDAVLVGVDDGKVVGSSSQEGMLEDFSTMVPKISTVFAAVLGRPVSTLSVAESARVTESHTKSVPAVLAFGEALDAVDRGDADRAKRACRRVEQEDPSFRLARRFCALVPAAWMSLDAVAQAVETAALPKIAAGGLSFGQKAAIGVGAAAVVGGGIAAGIIASDGGGGGDGGGARGNEPALQLSPESQTVVAGQTAVISATCSDPDGTPVTITADNPPPGSTFQTSGAGNPAAAEMRVPTRSSDAGRTIAATFRCTDSAEPPSSVTRTAQVNVRSPDQPPPTGTPPPPVATATATRQPTVTPTPSSAPTPTATTPLCLPDGSPCEIGPECCGQTCYFGTCETPL
ncbi:MAG: hypothetical protein QOD06_3515 [Candidatus Binatota bacterium]|nr:hypothetical protein [Candidatus Binatota bacterium]